MCNECDSRHKEYIKQGREEFRLELMKEMQKLWAYYMSDKENVPRPDFMSVLALMDLIKDRQMSDWFAEYDTWEGEINEQRYRSGNKVSVLPDIERYSGGGADTDISDRDCDIGQGTKREIQNQEANV